VKRIPLSRGLEAVVDNVDYPSVSKKKWHAMKGGRRGYTWYAARSLPRKKGRKRKRVWMHHEILERRFGFEIDHRDGNGLNNTRENLRYATKSQNRANRRMVPHSSKFKGVRWHKRDKRWLARIKASGRQIELGAFCTEIEAAKAYNRAALEHHGEFSVLNSV
jgi:hypothetical protein